MTLTIDVYKDYVMIGDQKLMRPPGTAAGTWMSDWDRVKNIYLTAERPALLPMTK